MVAEKTNRAVAPVRLSMLNLNVDMAREDQSAKTRQTKTPFAAVNADKPRSVPQEAQQNSRQTSALMRQFRGEIGLRVYAHDDNNRINERDPSVCLNYVLLKQWCMMNALEMYDIDDVLN